MDPRRQLGSPGDEEKKPLKLEHLKNRFCRLPPSGRIVEPLMICHASRHSIQGVLQRFTFEVHQLSDTPGSSISTQTDMLA